MQGANLYFEGTTELAIKAAVTAFTRTYCTGTGRIRLDEASIGSTLLLASFKPLVQTNIPETYGKITVSSFDANGVWEGFLQTVQDKPDEITVLDNKKIEDFTYSATLEVIVAPDGNDETGNGTLTAPYRTLDRALKELAYRDGGIIRLRGGTYALTKSVEISAPHSGTETSPLIITAYGDEKVTFTAGVAIGGDACVKAADADFLSTTEK